MNTRVMAGWTFGLLASIALIVLAGTGAQPLFAQTEPDALAATPVPTPTPTPPVAPSIVAPLDGAITTGASNAPVGMPTFNWKLPVIAQLYQLQVSDSPGFSTMLVDVTTRAETYTPTDVWPDGTYYWRVRASNGTPSLPNWGPYTLTSSFTKDWSDNKSVKPSLLKPEESALRENFQLGDFSWTPVPGAAGYRLEISGDPLFNNIAYTADTLAPQHTPDERLTSTLYYWRVIPFTHQSTQFGRIYGEPSETRQFVIGWNTPPQLLAPLSQQDPASIVELAFAPRFEWTAVEGAEDYVLEISTAIDFNPATTYTTRNTDYTPTAPLSDDQEYFWRVKAMDRGDHATQWSPVGRFRIKWNFPPKLLTPANNQLTVSYPFFSWEPIPGVEYYEFQIDDSDQFGTPIASAQIFNATSYTNPSWGSSYLRLDSDYFWRVRGVNAQNHTTPWSQIYAFRTSLTVVSNLIYPHYYYIPDNANLPVHKDVSVAWPVFVWDTAHQTIPWPPGSPTPIALAVGPDYYQLEVDETPDFPSPNFAIQTLGLAAAPTLENPFQSLSSGTEYYWRVRSFRNGLQLGYDIIWKMRYDQTKQELPFSSIGVPDPLYPANAGEAVGTPPVLGWLPVTGANNYAVQISRTPAFTAIVDEAHPTFVNYVPWQGKLTGVPNFGTFWWRVRAESAAGVPTSDWSQPRSFSLSYDLVASNTNDFVPPGATGQLPLATPTTLLSDTGKYSSTVTYVTASSVNTADDYELGALHVMVDRTYENAPTLRNLHWVIAFGVAGAPSGPVRYGIFVDIDHRTGSGATIDPLGNAITADSMYRPEYALYLDRSGTTVTAKYYVWIPATGQWDLQDRTIESIGGWVWYASDTRAIQLLVPYTAFGVGSAAFSGSLALAVFSTSQTEGAVLRNSIPAQGINPETPASTIDNPAFVSDMLMPLYPFDAPLGSALLFEDLPALQWRTPVFDSVDGYQVEVARDVNFSDRVELWEVYETQTSSFFTILPAGFHSKNAYADNESYYWRVRIRHERFDTTAYDYGAWSPPRRFKLDSRLVGNPRLSTGPNVFMTPTFEWDRVEGAAGYTIQVDNDANFSSPIINQTTVATNFTPGETTSASALLSLTQYYWRIAMRRSDTILGRWTDPLPFVKTSVAPTPVFPLTTDPLTLFTSQPTLQWTPVLAPSTTPRMAAARYRIQIDDDKNFGSPVADVTTESTSYTPPKGKSLADREWHWRVAAYEASGQPGPYSAPQTFAKQYPLPALLWPPEKGVIGVVEPYVWRPTLGAAYYRLEIAANDSFQSAASTETPNASFTSKEKIANGVYYWRVRMYDEDKVAGPIVSGKYVLGYSLYLPAVEK